MTSESTAPVPPVQLTLVPELGQLDGSNGRYEKFLPDLQGLYRDDDAFQQLLADNDGSPTYWVESSQTEEGPGGLITVMSVGTERFVTLFCYAGDAGQDYSIIERAGGIEAVGGRRERGLASGAQPRPQRLPALADCPSRGPGSEPSRRPLRMTPA